MIGEIYRDGFDNKDDQRRFLGKVFVGSASDGVLEAGDRLLAINNRSTEGITHVEAQNIFRFIMASKRSRV